MGKLVYAIEPRDLREIRNYLQNEVIMLSLINIGVNVALRFSDLSNLKFEDIDKNEIIILEEKKTGKLRKIKLNIACIKEIEKLKNFYRAKNINPRGYLFKSFYNKYVKHKIDKPLTIQCVNRNFKKIKKDLKISYNIGTHSLRKTWGYYYYKKTKDLALIMKILNHSSEHITLHYIGITQEKIDEVFENFII